MTKEDVDKIMKAAKDLGRELVYTQIIPEVWGTSCSVHPMNVPGLKLNVMCSEAAKAKVLAKYNGEYQGVTLYFTIVSGPPQFG